MYRLCIVSFKCKFFLHQSKINFLQFFKKTIDKSNLTIVDLIGGEEKKDLPEEVKSQFATIYENLREFKEFYDTLAKGKQPRGKVLKLPEDCWQNAVHLLLFTAQLREDHTADTLKYVFRIKVNRSLYNRS